MAAKPTPACDTVASAGLGWAHFSGETQLERTMSHQTGIVPNEALVKFMAKARDSKCRVFKVVIDSEQLSLADSLNVQSDWKSDFSK